MAAAGSSGKPLAIKLGLRDGQRVWFSAMPESVQDEIDEYALELTFVGYPAEGVDAAHVFVTARSERLIASAQPTVITSSSCASGAPLCR